MAAGGIEAAGPPAAMEARDAASQLAGIPERGDRLGAGSPDLLAVGEVVNDENILASSDDDDPAGRPLPVPASARSSDGPAVGADGFGVAEVGPVQPVPRPRLMLVQPVPRRAKKGRTETGSTRREKTNVQPVPQSRNARKFNDLHPPTIPGCKWKPSGLSGWELYTRQPAISRNGKRSSKHKYVAYYSMEAVRREHERREATANARRA